MKNKLLIALFLLSILVSCINKKNIQNIPLKFIGEYYQEFDDNVIYSLRLKEDNTFTYIITGGKFSNSASECTGKWKINENDLLLECNEENLLNQFSSGYMRVREFKIKIISSKLLEIDGIKLKKK